MSLGLLTAIAWGVCVLVVVGAIWWAGGKAPRDPRE